MAEQTLQGFVEKFIKHLQDSGKSSLTIVAYKNDLVQLTTFLAKKNKTNPQEIINLDIEEFKADLANKNYTPKSVARKLNAIKGLFRFLTLKKHIDADPAQNVPHPKYELLPPRILSPLEYRALRDASREDARIAAIVELLLQTGMRISEVASLSLDQVTDNEVKLVKRAIPLNQPAKRAVETYIPTRPKTGSPHLFVTKTGRQLLVRNIRAAIERCFAEAGIERATVNDLRNTFIVHQLSAGVDLVNVSRAVGHKRLATTERYLSLVQDRKVSKNRGLSEL